jgi:hypothetical protein
LSLSRREPEADDYPDGVRWSWTRLLGSWARMEGSEVGAEIFGNIDKYWVDGVRIDGCHVYLRHLGAGCPWQGL